MGQFVRSHMPEENWFFPSASSHQLPILRVGFFEAISHSYWVFDQLGHVQVLCIAKPALVTPEYNDPATSRKHCFRLVFENLWLWRFLPFLLWWSLNFEGVWYRCPRWSWLFHSFLLSMLWPAGGFCINYQKRLLWVGLSSAFVYEYKDK